MKLSAIIVICCIVAVLIVNIINVIIAIIEFKRNKLIEYYIDTNKGLKRQNKIMKAYLQMIIDKCFDYDGCDTKSGLKDLIDDVNYYAELGVDCIDDEVCYTDTKGNLYNVLDEKIGDK